MEKKKDITREKLVSLIAKYIKECSKKLTTDVNCVEVSVEHSNYNNGAKQWAYSEIYFDHTSYKFYEKEITDSMFLRIMKDALEQSKCKGKVRVNEWTDFSGYYPTKKEYFDGLTLFGKSCKEFATMNRLLKKYTNKEVGELQVYYASVCGKRSSWDADMSDAEYLDFSSKRCQKIIDFIRKTKSTNDKLTFTIKENLSHGDETDYRIAQYQESEWYGSFTNNITLEVTTPKGKSKGVCKAYIQ